MPTLTFYVTDDVAKQLDDLVEFQTREQDRKVSRGDVLTPAIKKMYRTTIVHVHQPRKKAIAMTGDNNGLSVGEMK